MWLFVVISSERKHLAFFFVQRQKEICPSFCMFCVPDRARKRDDSQFGICLFWSLRNFGSRILFFFLCFLPHFGWTPQRSLRTANSDEHDEASVKRPSLMFGSMDSSGQQRSMQIEEIIRGLLFQNFSCVDSNERRYPRCIGAQDIHLVSACSSSVVHPGRIYASRTESEIDFYAMVLVLGGWGGGVLSFPKHKRLSGTNQCGNLGEPGCRIPRTLRCFWPERAEDSLHIVTDKSDRIHCMFLRRNGHPSPSQLICWKSWMSLLVPGRESGNCWKVS